MALRAVCVQHRIPITLERRCHKNWAADNSQTLTIT
jgi:hypothetical protein